MIRTLRSKRFSCEHSKKPVLKWTGFLLLRGLIVLFGQSDGKERSFAGRALDAYLAAMAFDDGFDQG